VPIRGIDHLYAETLDWEASAAFWEGLGFTFVSRWGSEGHRAGRLESGDAAVVLAEIGDGTPEFTAFFDLTDADGFSPGDGVTVTTPLQPTHWDTRWIRVADPDGRVHALEETP
jgi:catechol 2,3-dioxygenase-like lactoylglutathione lyase family enzyme